MKNVNGSSQTPFLLQVSEVEVRYRNKVPVADRPQIHRSEDAEQIFRANWSDNIELVEEFNVLLLNRANYVKGILRLSHGGITGTVADPRILFATALKGLATGLVFTNSHPAGCLIPSCKILNSLSSCAK